MTTIIMRTSEGDITINLFDDQTPVTVKNLMMRWKVRPL